MAGEPSVDPSSTIMISSRCGIESSLFTTFVSVFSSLYTGTTTESSASLWASPTGSFARVLFIRFIASPALPFSLPRRGRRLHRRISRRVGISRRLLPAEKMFAAPVRFPERAARDERQHTKQVSLQSNPQTEEPQVPCYSSLQPRVRWAAENPKPRQPAGAHGRLRAKYTDNSRVRYQPAVPTRRRAWACS